MIEAKDAVVWVNERIKEVRVVANGGPENWLPRPWGDPIGAAYAQWQEMTDTQRARLMTETAIDLAMAGFDLGTVLREFAKASITTSTIREY
ncbi:hypothetical protein [Bradyrhizobium sp. URHA0013]|uniref:hypothetical protein n=1 Tax=Bradyrhizobium sp. URHA0013 TaxID=1380352 RepID=UPI0004B41AEE|nr:hypothetical protein [Bradyrhizobium sp. URHA0013]